MKRFILAGLALILLSGCELETQERQLAQCRLAASDRYPRATLELGDKIQEYVTLCMEAQGYDLLRVFNDYCMGRYADENDRIQQGALYASCYHPKGYLANVVLHMEQSLRGR